MLMLRHGFHYRAEHPDASAAWRDNGQQVSSLEKASEHFPRPRAKALDNI
jgi:hypothetical protein